jgi:chromosome segregation ATPase
MFRSKPLIGTPRDIHKDNQGLEFTPIGGEGKHYTRNPKAKKNDAIHDLINKKRNPLNNSPLLNKLNGGSSFMDDNSYDTINYSAAKQPRKKSSSPINSDFQNRILLNDGSNPVRQQQKDISNLKSENYNLKVKVASLTKYLNAISSHDQQYIYEENSRLQEQIIALRAEVSQLNKELDSQPQEIKHTDDPRVEVLGEELRSERIRAEQLRYEMEHEIEESEKLQNDYEKLEKDYEDLLCEKKQLEEKIGEFEEEQQQQKSSSPASKALINELYAKIEDLRNSLLDKDYELRKADEELDQKDDELRKLDLKVKELDQMSDHDAALEGQMDELRLLLKDRDSEVEQMERQIHMLKNELEHNKTNASKSSHEVEDLSNALHATQKKLMLLEEVQSNRSTHEKSAQEILELKNQCIELEGEINNLKIKLKESKCIISEQKQVIDELKEAEFELESLIRDREHLKLKIDNLENDNERAYKAYDDLKKAAQQKHNSRKDEELWRSEIELLSNQVNDLILKNEKLSKDLEKEKEYKASNMDSYAKLEVKSLSSRCNELQMEISERDNAMQRMSSQHKRELERYKSALQGREDDLNKITDELRSLKISSTQKIDDEKIELLKIKREKESQVKLLQIELDNLKEEHKVEVASLKNLMEKSRMLPNTDLIQKEPSQDKTDRLLQGISEKNKRIKYLTEKLTSALLNVKDLQSIISQLEKSKADLQIDNKRLELRLDQLTDKLYEHKKEIRELVDKKVDPDDYNDMRLNLKLKEKEIVDYKNFKREFVEKYQQITDENQALQKRIEKIIGKYRQLQNSLSNTITQSKGNTRLQSQADYYKMKHTRASYTIKDLKFMNSFMVKSIQATGSHIKEDIKKMQQVGIYPDYELICKKKPTISVLVKFVIAAVRMKRKAQHSSVRNQKIELLETKLLQ